MADREIKTRFRLEGESEYRRAMKESADAIKVLASEQKLAAAEFEATGDAQEYAAETARILKDQIREQERAVQAAQQAVEKLKAAGVDPADKSMQQWNTRLNTAKTRLLNMQTQLGKADTALGTNKEKLDQSDGSAKNFGDQLERIGKNIDFTATITAIDNIKGKIESVIKTAAKAAKGFWDMQTDAGKWADDLATAAAKAGMDVETYQSWNYASQLIDTDASKIISTITRLEKDLGSENKEIAKAFNQLGVSTRAAGGQVKNATDVFWDVVDALGRIENPTRRSILAQRLLGESWKDLNPLIEAGSQAYKDLAQEGLDTAVVSEENVKKLGEMNDAQSKLNSSIQKAKFDTLAALAPTFTEVSNALNTAVGALNDFLQSEAGQEALSNLNEALSGVIKSFLGEDGGKGTFESIVSKAAGALEKANEALVWVQDNGELIKGIVLGLVGAWGGLEIASSVLSLLNLLQKVPLEKLSAVFGGSAAQAVAGASSAAGAAGAAGTAAAGAASAARTAAAGSAAAGPTTLVGTATNPLLNGLSLGALLKTGIEYAKKTDSGILGAAYKKANPDLKPIKIAGFMDENGNVVEPDSPAADAINAQAEQVEQAAERLNQATEEANAAVEKTAAEIGKKITVYNWDALFQQDPENEIWKQLFGDFDLDWVKQNWSQAAEYMLQVIKEKTPNGEMSTVANETGKEMDDGLAAGIQDNQGVVESAAADTAASAQTGADETLNNGSMETIGYNASIGLANGIVDGQDEVMAAAQAVAQSAADTMASALEIGSPSRVMARLGGYVVQGFAEGIDRGINDVERAVSRMSGAAFRAPVMAAPQGPRIAQAAAAPMGAGGAAGGAAGQNIQAVIMMDKKTVGYLVAPVVNEAIGAIIQEQRE